MPVTPGKFLNRLIVQLGSPYGVERSIKICRSVIVGDRALLSVHKNALGETPERTLFMLLKKLGFPAQFYAAVRVRLESADIVHFGYEGKEQGFYYKCYLEFAEAWRKAQEIKKPERQLVHYAVKWDPQNASDARISYYYSQPASDQDAVKYFLSKVYAGNRMSMAYRMMLDILGLAEVVAMHNELMLLAVTEEVNDRLSFDINFYDTQLCLADISSQLAQIAAYFEVNKQAWDKLYKSNSSRELGHLAGGVDGNGSEFFSVYFGVEQGGTNLMPATLC